MPDDWGGAGWDVTEWRGKMLVDRDGEKIGKLQDVYVDVETDEPQFGTVKEGFFDRHLTFVPLGGTQVGPDGLQVAVTKDQVRSAPDIEMHGEELSQADESTLYHHFEMNYTPPEHRERTASRPPLRVAQRGLRLDEDHQGLGQHAVIRHRLGHRRVSASRS